MTEELQELEPIEEPAAAAAAAPSPAQAPRVHAPGLPAPAFNPAADKEYYRFLFAGMVMFIGCLMPFGPDWTMAGYKTLSGALFMLIAIGMIWSWWGAISTNRFSGKNLKWVGLALIPFIVELMNIIGAFDSVAVRDAVRAAEAAREPVPVVLSWGEFFESFVSRDPDVKIKADNFIRLFGAGKFVVFLGAVLAELFMLMAVFGGAKAAKAQKAQKTQKAATPRSGGRRR